MKEKKLYYSFWERQSANSPKVAFLAVGDIMLSREVGEKIVKYGPYYPFNQIQSLLTQESLVFVN